MDVLIVEDNADHAFLLQRVLEKAPGGVRASVAKNGRVALDLLHSTSRPNLILLDLNMPLVDGFEVLDARRQDAAIRDIPTVVVTTSSRESDRERAIDLGADGFLIKTGYRDLKAAVHELLERYRPS